MNNHIKCNIPNTKKYSTGCQIRRPIYMLPTEYKKLEYKNKDKF